MNTVIALYLGNSFRDKRCPVTWFSRSQQRTFVESLQPVVARMLTELRSSARKFDVTRSDIRVRGIVRVFSGETLQFALSRLELLSPGLLIQTSFSQTAYVSSVVSHVKCDSKRSSCSLLRAKRGNLIFFKLCSSFRQVR